MQTSENQPKYQPLKAYSKKSPVDYAHLNSSNYLRVAEWCGARVNGKIGSETDPLRLHLPNSIAILGDYIVKRRNDGFVQFTPEDFRDTYVRADW